MNIAGYAEIIGNSLRGIPKTQEHIENNRHAQLGKKLSEAHKQKLRDNENLRLSRLGTKNPAYIHGNSKRAYPAKFYKIRKSILERDNYTCQFLRCYNMKNLTVHHIDYDKDNNKENNLITLCNIHNLKANSHRNTWKNIFRRTIAQPVTL